MILLPTNLAPIADIAAKDAGKYAIAGIDLIVKGKHYTAAATDGKRLVVVEGEHRADLVEFFPEGPIHTAPNGAARAIIPAKGWKETFRNAVKTTKKASKREPATQHVAVNIGDKVTSFAATDGQANQFDQHTNEEGRFPPYRDVIPPTSKAIVVQRIDPDYLVSVLNTVAHFTNEENIGVDLEVHRNGHLVLRAASNEQKAIGLVVGLGEPKHAKTTSVEVEQLSDRIAELERERDELATAIASRPALDQAVGKTLSRRERLQGVIG